MTKSMDKSSLGIVNSLAARWLDKCKAGDAGLLRQTARVCRAAKLEITLQKAGVYDCAREI